MLPALHLRYVPEGFESDGERFFGFIEKSFSHGIVSGIDDLLLDANEASVEVAFPHILT